MAGKLTGTVDAIYQGFTSPMQGGGSLYGSVTQQFSVAAAFSGSGAPAGEQQTQSARTSALAGVGSLSSTSGYLYVYNVNLSGTGSFGATTNVINSKIVAMSGSGTLTASTMMKKFAAVSLSGTGSLSATVRPSPLLATYSTAGAFTYSIPGWATKLDVVMVGAGGGGNVGGAGYANGGGGGAGTWATKTLTRGVDFPSDATTLAGIVGALGAGAPAYGSASDGSPSLVGTVTSTANGAAGVAGSSSNSISVTYNHTPAATDLYAIVYVGVSCGTLHTSVTRTATFGGSSMTSLGVTKMGSGAGGIGWTEAFGIPITVGTSTSQIVVTASYSGGTFSAMKSNSVSLGGGPVVLLPSFTGSGTSTASGATDITNWSPPTGSMTTGAAYALSSMNGTYSYAPEYVSTAAPSFAMFKSATTFGIISANLSSSAAWAAVGVTVAPLNGAGGKAGAGQGIQQAGYAPGNKTFNGQTYTGGVAGQGDAGQQALAPGAGGGGGTGPLIGSAPGMPGTEGRVFIYAYQ